MQPTEAQRRLPCRAWAVAAVLLVGAGPAPAQTTNAPPLPPPPLTNRWESAATAGLTLTQGNSDTVVGTLGLETQRKWNRNEAALGAAGGYGEDQDVKNTEYFTAFGQYNRLFSERFYAGLRTSFNYDGIANLSYRITTGPLMGYYLVKETNTTFSVEAGPSAVFEKYEGQAQHTYLGFRLGQRFEHQLSATTRVWEAVSYVPDVERWAQKYSLLGEAGIEAAINKRWSLRIVFQDIFESEPADGRKQNDVRLIAGTAYKF